MNSSTHHHTHTHITKKRVLFRAAVNTEMVYLGEMRTEENEYLPRKEEDCGGGGAKLCQWTKSRVANER